MWSVMLTICILRAFSHQAKAGAKATRWKNNKKEGRINCDFKENNRLHFRFHLVRACLKTSNIKMNTRTSTHLLFLNNKLSPFLLFAQIPNRDPTCTPCEVNPLLPAGRSPASLARPDGPPRLPPPPAGTPRSARTYHGPGGSGKILNKNMRKWNGCGFLCTCDCL